MKKKDLIEIKEDTLEKARGKGIKERINNIIIKIEQAIIDMKNILEEEC